MRVSRIDHVAMVVRDIDAASLRFQAQFGMSLVSEPEARGSLRMAYLKAGDSLLQLISPVGPGPILDFLDSRGEGLHHLCFAVPSVEDESVGMSHRLLPKSTGGMGAAVRFLADPVHGAVIELSEPVQPGSADTTERRS